MGIVEFALLAITSIVAVMEPASTITIYAALTKEVSQEKSARLLKNL